MVSTCAGGCKVPFKKLGSGKLFYRRAAGRVQIYQLYWICEDCLNKNPQLRISSPDERGEEEFPFVIQTGAPLLRSDILLSAKSSPAAVTSTHFAKANPS